MGSLHEVYRFEDQVRRSFGFTTPNYAGAFFITVALFCVVIPFPPNRDWLKSRICLGVVMVVMTVLTYSRGAVFGFALGAGVIFAAVGLKRVKDIPPRSMIIMISLIVTFASAGMGVGFMRRASPQYVNSDASVSSRIAVWKGAIHEISDRPFTGWGFARSGKVYSEFYQPLSDTTRYNTPVSGILTIGAELGIPCLAVLLTIALYGAASIFSTGSLAYGPNWRLAIATTSVVTLGCNVFSTLGLGLVLPLVYAVIGIFAITLIAHDLRRHRWRPMLASGLAGLSICLGLLAMGCIEREDGWYVDWKSENHVSVIHHQRGSVLARGGKREVASVFQDTSSRNATRDVRTVMACNTWLQTCEIYSRANHAGRKMLPVSNHVIVAMGDWIPLLVKEEPQYKGKLFVVNPNATPEECGLTALTSHPLRPTGIILPEVDISGVATEWIRYAGAAGVPVVREDYRAVALDKL